jgi:hypothetical protein
VRWSVVLFVLGLAGVVGGAALVGRWAVGCAVIADSVVLAVLAWMRDLPEKPAKAKPTVIRRRAA